MHLTKDAFRFSVCFIQTKNVFKGYAERMKFNSNLLCLGGAMKAMCTGTTAHAIPEASPVISNKLGYKALEVQRDELAHGIQKLFISKTFFPFSLTILIKMFEIRHRREMFPETILQLLLAVDSSIVVLHSMRMHAPYFRTFQMEVKQILVYFYQRLIDIANINFESIIKPVKILISSFKNI